MTDDTAPEDSGTSEEQTQNIAVDAVGDATSEQEQAQQQEDEVDLEAELAELQDKLANLDPENVGAVACVVCTKQPMEDAADEDAPEAPDGFSWRVMDDSLEGYDDVNDVLATLSSFNDGLERCEVQFERPSGPMDLGAMLGLE